MSACTCGHLRVHHDPDDGCGACAMAMRPFRHDYQRARCSGSGQRTRRGRLDEPDRCPVCERVAYVCVDGTTGSHRR